MGKNFYITLLIISKVGILKLVMELMLFLLLDSKRYLILDGLQLTLYHLYIRLLIIVDTTIRGYFIYVSHYTTLTLSVLREQGYFSREFSEFKRTNNT